MPSACKKCGKCCKGFWFPYSKKQILKNLADMVEQGSDGDIIEQAKFLVMIKWEKKAKKKNGLWKRSCKFYDKKKGCTIQTHKPFMCKRYPYGRKGQHKDCGYKGRKKNKWQESAKE